MITPNGGEYALIKIYVITYTIKTFGRHIQKNRQK